MGKDNPTPFLDINNQASSDNTIAVRLQGVLVAPPMKLLSVGG
jgi:hypothetical protein